MDQRRQKFLASVLGEEGAGLLIKTIDQTPVLEHAIVPRTILAWLQSASSFEGLVSDGVEMVFEKSESGFAGSIAMGAESYSFEAANVFHVAASVAVSLGIEELEQEGLRTLDIERLGKSIDLMTKAHRVTVELEKADAPAPAAPTECSHRKNGNISTCVKCKADKVAAVPRPEMGKDEPPAQDLDKAIGDSAPPVAPTAAKPQKSATPKISTAAPKVVAPKATSTSTMSLTRSEASAPCGACGKRQFVENTFVGCLCMEAFCKAVKVVSATDSGLVLELDRRMLEQDDVDALMDVFKASGVSDGE